jgi:hypothetical protein
LDVSGCPQLTGAGFEALTQLTRLTAQSASGLTDGRIACLTGLEELDVSECPRLTGTGFEALTQLTRLDAEGVYLPTHVRAALQARGCVVAM